MRWKKWRAGHNSGQVMNHVIDSIKDLLAKKEVKGLKR